MGIMNPMRYIMHNKIEDEEFLWIYNKDILIRNYFSNAIRLPGPYQIFGCINYKGNELKLDVSRNEIISGHDSLFNEIKTIVLKNEIDVLNDREVIDAIKNMLNI